MNCKPGSSPSTLSMCRWSARPVGPARSRRPQRLQLEFRAKHPEKLGRPSRVRGPCRRRDQVTVDNRFADSDVRVGAASACYVRSHRWICAALSSLQYAGGGKYLRSVADGSDGFLGLVEVAHNFEDARIQPDVLGSPPAGKDQCIVIFGLDLVERGIQWKVV